MRMKDVISRMGLKPLANRVWPVATSALSLVKRFHTVTRNGIRYRLDLNEDIDSNIYALGEWESHTCRFLRETVLPGDDVIEVGANIGAHTLLLGKLASPGHIFAFEATSSACKKLRQNLALNQDIDNVAVIQSLVTNHEHEAPKQKITYRWPRLQRRNDTEIVPGKGVSLDDFVFEPTLKRLSLLKIDVDGYDYKVLQGATRLIKRFWPWIFIELSEPHLNEVGDSAADAHKLMHSYKYRLHSTLGINKIFQPPRTG